MDDLSKVVSTTARATATERRLEARLRAAMVVYFKGLRARLLAEAQGTKIGA